MSPPVMCQKQKEPTIWAQIQRPNGRFKQEIPLREQPHVPSVMESAAKARVHAAEGARLWVYKAEMPVHGVLRKAPCTSILS